MSKINCKLCNKHFKNKNSLGNHLRTFHQVLSVCDISDFEYKIEPKKQSKMEKSVKCQHNVNIKCQHSVNIKKKNNEMNDNIIINDCNYKCKICFKIYKYKKSLLTHLVKCNKKQVKIIKEEDIYYFCKYCNNKYKYRQSKSRHELKCKNSKTNFLCVNNEKQKEHGTIINTNCNNTININNTINVLAIGKENLPNRIPDEIQIKILNKGRDCLTYLINYIHFNPDYPEYQSIRLNNTRGMIGYLFNEETKRFEAIPKKELIELVKYERLCDIENFYEYNSNNLNKMINNQVTNLIDKVNNDNKNENIKIECALYNGTKNIDKK
jgi:uncharacterized protein YbaR (Trm112 family)